MTYSVFLLSTLGPTRRTGQVTDSLDDGTLQRVVLAGSLAVRCEGQLGVGHE